MSDYKDTVKQIWFLAITSECALNYNTGLINRAGSPFVQFRQQYPECPRNKKQALKWMKQFADNNQLRVTNYFTNTLNRILQ